MKNYASDKDREDKLSLTIEGVKIYKEDLDKSLSKDVFDTLVGLANEQRGLNMNLMRVQFAIAGFSNTLVGLMNDTPVKGAINPDVDIEETAAFPPEDTE
jgi:hypothetical protein